MEVGDTVGPFYLESELGSGAMGTVYKAHFEKTGEYVAFKVISSALLTNETAKARFEREGSILKQLHHPNIVRLIAMGRKGKFPFLAMEFVEGESLNYVLDRRTMFDDNPLVGVPPRRNPFSWEEVVAIGKQLCAALQHAHMKGIIHRDLKPSNVMVLADGTVKLTDFGIAKDVDVTALTGDHATVGTAAYMSPEQCRGERNLTAKSDLYSLGIMFYELLTGQKPFDAATPYEMFVKHVEAEFEPPNQRALTIPVSLNTLVCQLMEKKPHLRPFDAAMVGSVLAEIEEKEAEQRSAGIDAATARRIDRPGQTVNTADREAARALLASVTKKKVRKKRRRSAPGAWLRVGALVAGLLGLVAVLVVMTRPPSADKLFQAAKVAVDARDEDRAIEATQRYLDVFPDVTDAQSSLIRTWYVQNWVAHREKQLFNRFERKMTPDDEGQQLHNDAMRNENEGDSKRAAELWSEMEAKFKNSPSPEPAVYAWVAHKKLDDLKQLDQRQQNLTATIKAERAGREPERKPESEAERLSHNALRYEQFGDQPAARERWIRVRDEYLKPLDVRLWGILAAERVHGLVAVPAEMHRTYRVDLLKRKLAEAEKATPASDPIEKRDSAFICRDIIALYGRDPDPDIAACARKAEQKLREIGAS